MAASPPRFDTTQYLNFEISEHLPLNSPIVHSGNTSEERQKGTGLKEQTLHRSKCRQKGGGMVGAFSVKSED